MAVIAPHDPFRRRLCRRQIGAGDTASMRHCVRGFAVALAVLGSSLRSNVPPPGAEAYSGHNKATAADPAVARISLIETCCVSER
jgi:hypothetical protein